MWRFLVHDRPETECFWVSDVDEPLRDTDLRCIEALESNMNLSAALCVPTWHVNPIDDRKNSIDAGGFGMRRHKFDICMKQLLDEYIKEHGDLARKYCSDEFFLLHYIEPYFTSHEVKRVKRGNLSAVYSAEKCKPFMLILKENGMTITKKARAPKRKLVVPKSHMTLRTRIRHDDGDTSETVQKPSSRETRVF